MERLINVTEARSQLPALIKEVAEQDNQIVIATRNEPKAVIMSYDAFRNQQELLAKGAEYRLPELIQQAQRSLQETQEACQTSGEPQLYLFWTDFGRLMRNVWEIAKDYSRPHAAIAFQLFELSERCLAGDAQLTLEHLLPLNHILLRLIQRELTMEDAAEMDRYLLQHDIDARFPVYIQADINALYKIDEYGSATEDFS